MEREDWAVTEPGAAAKPTDADSDAADRHRYRHRTDDVPNFVLLPRAAEELKIPFVASGGVANGKQLVAALGPGASAPLVLIFVFDSLLLFSIIPFLMALAGVEKKSPLDTARQVAWQVATHPFNVDA
eukprot:gene15396-20400_t